MSAKRTTMRHVSGRGVEQATRAVMGIGRDLFPDHKTETNRSVARAIALSKVIPQYGRLKEEQATSTSARISTDAHRPKDARLIRLAARRRAEAEAWIAEVKARKKP